MTEIYGSRVILNIGIAKILGDLSRIYHREFDWSYWSKIRARHCLWLMHFWRLPMVTNRWQEWRHREEVCFITAHQWLSHQCSLIQNQHHERYVLNCPLPPYFNWVPNIPWPQLHASLQCVHQFHQWWWQMLQLKFDLINNTFGNNRAWIAEAQQPFRSILCSATSEFVYTTREIHICISWNTILPPKKVFLFEAPPIPPNSRDSRACFFRGFDREWPQTRSKIASGWNGNKRDENLFQSNNDIWIILLNKISTVWRRW